MKELNIRELIKYKKLPFNVYNEKGQVVMYTGDLLTPGKILELKEAKVLIYDENFEKKSKQERENPLVMKRKMSKQKAFIDSIEQSEDIDYREEESQKNVLNLSGLNSVKDLRINQKSVFSPDFQLSIKKDYEKILTELKNQNYQESKTNFLNLTEKIRTELTNKISEIQYLSQLKLIGEYKTCNPLNVAILSGFLAMKNFQLNTETADIILCGLMHDIGKTKINQDIAYKRTIHVHEHAEYEKHVIIGYKTIKEIFQLGNKIARPALEHHVLSDGNGYPKGVVFDSITEESKIIAISNYYDKLSSNRTNHLITYNYEVGKALLKDTSKKYPANLIYDIANKYILNDTSKLLEIVD